MLTLFLNLPRPVTYPVRWLVYRLFRRLFYRVQAELPDGNLLIVDLRSVSHFPHLSLETAECLHATLATECLKRSIKEQEDALHG